MSERNQVGVITFPGSNGDHDAFHSLSHDVGVPARLVDYRETDLDSFAALVVPGGFSYGDYLRCGAIARFAPVIEPLRRFAAPGALLRNDSLEFRCHWVNLRVEQTATAWTEGLSPGAMLHLPIAHGDGSYFADAETLDRLEATGRIVARYCDEHGEPSAEANPNGSIHNIAAIANEAGNVVGLMPHPERATDPAIGGDDGLKLLRSVLSVLNVPA
jgi:phosphoribosylformylglycinamidine synthase subunit PurQ / glutaminase